MTETHRYLAVISYMAMDDYVVKFPVVPEALSGGKTEEEAIGKAKDALITALRAYKAAGRPFPKQGSLLVEDGWFLVAMVDVPESAI